MTAKEMFKELGYEYNANISEIMFLDYIVYEKNLDTYKSMSRRYISFNLKEKTVSTEEYLKDLEKNEYRFYDKQPNGKTIAGGKYIGQNDEYIYILPNLKKAIQKQIEELGW